MGFVALGDVGDVGDTDVSADPRSAYVAWAAAVKRAGGIVSHTPHLRTDGVSDPESGAIYGGGEPILAAQYPLRVVFPSAPAPTLAPAFHRQPDDWSNDGNYVYYIAPPGAQNYAAPATGEITQPQQVPGEPPPPNPDWYDSVLKAAKLAGVGVGVILVLDLLSFLPRRR